MKLVRLLALLLPGLACAQVNLPDPHALSPADWYQQVQEASRRGEQKVVHRLFNRDAPPPPEGVEPYRYYTNLARAAFDCEWFPGVHLFIRQAGTPPGRTADLRWLSGLAALYESNDATFAQIHKFYTDLDPQHPAAAYLAATQQFLEWRKIGPLHPEGPARYASAVESFRLAYEDPLNRQKYGDPDTRFLRLRTLLAEFDPDAEAYARAISLLSTTHPYNLNHLRDSLAASGGEFNFELMSLQLTAARPSAEELARWQRFATAGAGQASPAEATRARLAEIPDEAGFARTRRHFLRTEFKRHGIIARVEAWHAQHPPAKDPAAQSARAAAYAPLEAEFGPAYPALLATYARLATTSGNPADCYYALRLMDAHLTQPGADRAAFAPHEITLAAAAGDHPRAVALVEAQADRNATNLAWWQQHARLMHDHGDLATAFLYLRHLASLQPDNLVAQFNVVGLADREVRYDQALIDIKHRQQIFKTFSAEPPEQQENHRFALLASSDARTAAYGELFKRVPAEVIPPTRHWENYEKLLRGSEESFLRASGSSASPTGATYRQLVERCYQEKPNDPTILREARKVRTAEALRTARATMSMQPGSEGAETKARYQAALAAAKAVGVSDSALAPAREAYSVYELRERGAAVTAGNRDARPAPRPAEPTPPSVDPALLKEILAKFKRRQEFLLRLKAEPGEIKTASQVHTSHQQLQAQASVGRKLNELSQLCPPCDGQGLEIDLTATEAKLRRCPVCQGKGVNFSYQGSSPTAGFESLPNIVMPRNLLGR